MTTTSVLQKMGVKPDMRMILVDAPPDALKAINLPDAASATELTDDFDYIHLFVTMQNALDEQFPKLKRHLRAGGMLWISWPKGKGLGSDLSLKQVIAIGYHHGMVESKTISINPTWSAIKFTFPKEGKHYNNSYGQLGKRTALES